MYIGILRWFDTSRGLGFIQPEDGGVEVFVHAACVVASGMPSMTPGRRLGYEIEPDDRCDIPYAAVLLEVA